MSGRYLKDGKGRLIRASFMIRRDQDEELDRITEWGISKSEVMRRALDHYLADHKSALSPFAIKPFVRPKGEW